MPFISYLGDIIELTDTEYEKFMIQCPKYKHVTQTGHIIRGLDSTVISKATPAPKYPKCPQNANVINNCEDMVGTKILPIDCSNTVQGQKGTNGLKIQCELLPNNQHCTATNPIKHCFNCMTTCKGECGYNFNKCCPGTSGCCTGSDCDTGFCDTNTYTCRYR